MRAFSKGTILGLVGMLALTVNAQEIVATTHGYDTNDLISQYSSTDLAQGLTIGLGLTPVVSECVQMGATDPIGFHSANQQPQDQWDAFTDGVGPESSIGLYGLLADNYQMGSYDGASGRSVNSFILELPTVSTIGQINVFTGNPGNADGRIFHTYTVQFSPDGVTFSDPVYVQSDPYTTINREGSTSEPGYRTIHARWTATKLYDAIGPLATGIKFVKFRFFSSSHPWSTPGGQGGWFSDPYTGLNPYTNEDDGIQAPDTSPLLYEVDVLSEKTVVVGDTNGDGCVDDGDLTNVILDYGTEGGTSGDTDINHDLVVDDADITLLVLNYGAGC